MSDMSMEVLKVVVSNDNLPANERMSAVSAAFPNYSYALLEGYIYQLRAKGYLSVQSGDNRIVAIGVNPSAYVALHEGTTEPVEESSTQINIGSIGNVSGQVVLGNKGGSYNMHVTKIMMNETNNALKSILTLADNQSVNPFERERIKKIVTQIAESFSKSEPPPKGLIEQLDSFAQKHSWISAPLAAALLQSLSKFLS